MWIKQGKIKLIPGNNKGMENVQSNSKFSIYAWAVFGYNLLVIAWGAYVRATGSGAGCGAHWPLCNGDVIPRSPQIETIVEYSHRISSGLVLVLALVLVIWAWHSFPRGSRVRKGAAFVLLFTITEALVGAGLVLFELVAQNTSNIRAWSMIVHLINTYLLLGSIILTAWWSSRGDGQKIHWPGLSGFILLTGLVGLLLLGASGAVTALGDTLFPANTLAEGLKQDSSPTAHIFIRLRVLHPVIATAIGVYLWGAVVWLRRRVKEPLIRKTSTFLLALFVTQLVLGTINVILLAPVWLQMVHLVVSDLIWGALVLTTEILFTGRQLMEGSADESVKIGIEQGATEYP